MVSIMPATRSTLLTALDPRYEEEVSGCTATVAIISAKKIFVVCSALLDAKTLADQTRVTREIREPCLV